MQTRCRPVARPPARKGSTGEACGFTLVELPAVSRRGTRGFTLVELMVVMLIIILAAAVTLPSIIKIFTAGADVMSFNLLSAQLESARVLAMENNRPAAVHVQMVDGSTALNGKLKGTQYGCVVSYDSATGLFDKAPGYQPLQFPGNYAFGQADGFRIGTDWSPITDHQLYEPTTNYYGDFTTFTVVFDTEGRPLRRIAGNPIAMDPLGALFLGDDRLWATPAQEEGAFAVTLFSYPEVEVLTPQQRQSYLNTSGQYLMVHHYTGLLYERK